MRLNNKGFAISGTIYALMFLFIILIFATLGLLGSRKIILDKYKNEVLTNLKSNTDIINLSKVDKSGASMPVLSPNMIPVIYDGTNFVKAEFISEYDQDWYNYEEKRWANAVIIKNSERNNYVNIVPGTIINDNDILAYYVWIPRYKYKLFNTNLMNLVNTPVLIEIVFENIYDDKSNGTVNGEYLTHPAFTFGNTSISGFWVSKFEMTGDLTNISSLPNQTPIINYSIKEYYDGVINNSSLYGSDLHIIKNDEWAAISYLTNSKYGLGTTEVRKNNYNLSYSFKTGCGSNTVSNALRTADCEIVFKESNEYPQSTTGNIYGIFDMSGGAWEYVMGVMKDSSNNVIYSQSGFTSSNMPIDKYYNTYSYGTSPSDISRGTLGSATNETWGWYSDRSSLVVNDYPWQFRGGCNNDTDDVGIFAFSSGTGEASPVIGFRTSIILE